jgi:deoxyribodipyrimidine photo-lyase
MKKYKLGIFIFRRDFRLDYNTGLIECLNLCEKILPIFIFTPTQTSNINQYKSDKSIQFMIESLDDLNSQINKYNGKIFFLYGDNIKILNNIISFHNIDAIFVNKDYTPYSKNRDKLIENLCIKNKITFHSFHDVCLFPPGTITTDNNNIYQKFTPFYNKCMSKIENIERKKKLKVHKNWFYDNFKSSFIFSLKEAYIKLTKPSENVSVYGGRDKALDVIKQLKYFKNYSKCRDNLIYKTTNLSAYLKFGCISPIEVFNELMNISNKNNDLIRQLIWRDFYIHILHAFPRVLQGKSLKENYDKIKWENNKELFNHWKNGNTGFPIVDACMRQLNKTGFMHNRGRMIVASFLIKNLLIDWRWGEKYFAQNLVDYDPAANNGNWQWVSGSGADSQPYFRIFNPWTQSEKFDKDCKYIKKWCPELEYVESKHIHNWDKYYNEYPNINYSKPVIDYKESREKAIKIYKKYI